MSEFPSGIRSVTVKPSHRFTGYSWGLVWPLVYGQLLPHCWAVWERDSGRVVHLVVRTPNVHGWSRAELDAMRLSMPPGAMDGPGADLDAVP